MATDRKTVAVIGSGPAGLMAADVLSDANVKVIICEAKPSVGRKFLMAGKSGLNLTKDEPDAAFLRGFYEAAPQMTPMLAGMGPGAVKRFAEGLGEEVFTGSSGRVFPKAMKASPMLRAWLGRLADKDVEVRTRWRWTGFEPSGRAEKHRTGEHQHDLRFETPDGPQTIAPDATILALGGASWSRLGSDGAWTDLMDEKGVAVRPFKPANMGLSVAWSALMAAHFGAPVKGVRLKAGEDSHLGEFVISSYGLEGSGIYAVSRAVREGAALVIDLLPSLSLFQATERLSKPRGKDSMANHLRKALKLSPVKRALLMEFGRPLPADPGDIARLIKGLPVTHQGPRPLDEAISVAGGVAWDAVDEGLMLRDLPGVFCAGEMLDWEAPTGGYLITGCLATGKWAGEHTLKQLSLATERSA
ncbi:MAG: TIGR03862 family flavoprotein [Rhizobiales bacterium]|nr:TIGR03862 family flavoprotein [Hyphomicrobiales bacterium]MBO6699400.1 TIGR03862 family flavoprotein [Hyphomicrobiales bacterium]MBO6736938.1 TIGR03862 family flavoprotein [Hyphomicrobiales bacterium]MBO6911988.1 TIGR03862 family flavoprotein [Hyphomicrobiales bacterium]MBO6954644.1 TIGR03862 family flavoprotein [Hyphomicrobiales bacterium]